MEPYANLPQHVPDALHTCRNLPSIYRGALRLWNEDVRGHRAATDVL